MFFGVNNAELATSFPTRRRRHRSLRQRGVVGPRAQTPSRDSFRPCRTDNSVAAASSRDIYARAAASINDLQLSFLDGRFLTLDEITTTLQNLPGQSVVMPSHFNQDRTSGCFADKLAR